MRRAVLMFLVMHVACAPAAPPDAPPTVEVSPAIPYASTVTPALSASAQTPAVRTREPDPCDVGATLTDDRVYRLVAGSFSAVAATEGVAAVTCGEQNGFALLRRAGDRWNLARFSPTIDSRMSRSDCQRLATKGGRDLAVCIDASVMYGEAFQTVVVLDYALPDESERIELVTVTDDTDTACTGKTDLVMGEIKSFALVDVDRDGFADVRVTLSARKVRVPPQPPCVAMGSVGAGQRPSNLPRKVFREVDFLARGTSLAPAPASVPVLKVLAALLPR